MLFVLVIVNMESIFLTIIYIVALPIAIVLIIWNIQQEISYLDYLRDVEWTRHEEKYKKMVSILKKINKFAVLFLILILVFLPLWNFTASVTLDQNIQSERAHVPGGYPVMTNPVSQRIAPTYNTDQALQEMEENPSIWLPEQVKEHVDLEELTSLPGRIAIYRLRGGRYIITYTYLAPYPIMRTYGFEIREILDEETNEEQIELVLMKEKTYIYPDIARNPDDLIY